jgi:hypothetical protein
VWSAANKEKVLLLEPAVTELLDLCCFIGGTNFWQENAGCLVI